MNQRCLLIADDLTGGADAGAQFAKYGLKTFLVSIGDHPLINFSKYHERDVLVVNTDSRWIAHEKAFSLTSTLLKNYNPSLFPIVYKKIDSTLRGNIGYEIDAILEETNGSLCFMAPSYPEQSRTLVGGIMIVGEKPLALTEVAQSTATPVQESYVYNLLHQQSQKNIGLIDLTHVAADYKGLQRAVESEMRRGSRIIIFDAVSRQDLTNVAEVGFSLEKRPIFVGSAGLAEEVAKKLAPYQGLRKPNASFKHIFIISGSASTVTHQQLRQVEKRDIAAFQLNKSLLIGKKKETHPEREVLPEKIANSLSKGMAILKVTPEILSPEESKGLPVHRKITTTLADIAISSLELSKVNIQNLCLILTGGDTAQSIINGLGTEGVEIEGELLGGIVKGHLIGGKWDGLSVVTKAGAFGKDDSLERIIHILRNKFPLNKEEE